MKGTIFLLLLAALPPGVSALELSLEENRGESGTIGYVDIDRVFKEYSGTLGAREEFLADIRKKEEAITQRKTAIYTLKADIAKLRQEREFALTLPGLFQAREQLADEAESLKAKAVDIASAAAAMQGAQAAVDAAAVQASSAAAQEAAPAVEGSTGAAQVDLSTGVAPAQPAQEPPAQAPAAQPPAEKPAALPAGLPGLGIDMPGISRVPTSYFKFSVSTAVPEIDAAIAARERELRDREEALKLYQRQAEVELLQYESHKTELILGRVYLALKELAVKEEVSVIVDKRSILFGHSAVDLTDKLLKKLEEGPL